MNLVDRNGSPCGFGVGKAFGDQQVHTLNLKT